MSMITKLTTTMCVLLEKFLLLSDGTFGVFAKQPSLPNALKLLLIYVGVTILMWFSL